MFRPKRYLLYLVIIIICGCDNSSRYPYSIKDYPNKLQPHLIKMLDKGIVMSDSVFQHLATDRDLERLGRSEHPILRASAFREMLQRKSFNHFEILMRHWTIRRLFLLMPGSLVSGTEPFQMTFYRKLPGKQKVQETKQFRKSLPTITICGLHILFWIGSNRGKNIIPT
jgi:hypothetical protein